MHVYNISENNNGCLRDCEADPLDNSCNLIKERRRKIDKIQRQTINMNSQNLATSAGNRKGKIIAKTILDPISIDNTCTEVVLLLLYRTYSKETLVQNDVL